MQRNLIKKYKNLKVKQNICKNSRKTPAHVWVMQQTAARRQNWTRILVICLRTILFEFSSKRRVLFSLELSTVPAIARYTFIYLAQARAFALWFIYTLQKPLIIGPRSVKFYLLKSAVRAQNKLVKIPWKPFWHLHLF